MRAQPPPTGIERDAHRLRNGLLSAAALALVLLGIGLAVPDLRDVLKRMTDANLPWLIVGVALEIASCLGYVAILRLILRRGPKWPVRWLGWAEMAFGAVVPVGGAGGLAVGVWAMRAWGLSWERIANRSAVIFLLTSAVNGLVLALAGFGVFLGIGSHKTGLTYGLVPGAGAAIALAGAVALPLVLAPHAGNGRIGTVIKRSATWIRDTARIAFRFEWRLLGAVGYLLFDIAVLWACLQSVGVSAPLLALVVGYQIGYLANLLPIPGGVGVLEGGLLGALLLYGLPAAPTAAAVVLYHAIALWVPALGGTVGFARLRATVRQPALVAAPEPAPGREAPASGQPAGNLAA
jgi:uncharacterized membrane protein YbhN (UPF0104 family)